MDDARQRWKVYYRQLRIARRECAKAAMDCMTFGVGFTSISSEIPDFIRHVPLGELIDG